MLQRIIDALKSPSGFRNDWYGYATNQLSHILLGFLALGLISWLGFTLMGEFAQRWLSWLITATLFFLWELSQRSGLLWDKIEDWVFMSIYGAGSAALLFKEVEPGSPLIITEITNIPPMIAIISGHLLTGVWFRLIRGKR